MRYLSIALALALSLLAVPLLSVSAMPNENNPNVVAYYENGPHAIVGEPDVHYGKDVVMKAGNSGNFQQWFYGTSALEGEHGEHSVWQISKDGTCPDKWDHVADPHPEWGDYLTPGTDYCVHTNEFKSK